MPGVLLTSRLRCLGVATVVAMLGWTADAAGQSFGVELNNTLMPASGAMAGTSIAQPQDLTSAINGNPATLSRFRGTQFLFGGAWAEPTMNVEQTVPIPLLGVDPFAGKSTAQGSAASAIGITQELDMLGLPATLGLGFITAAGGAADFRHIPASNGTNSSLMVFELTAGLGVDLTERLAAGVGLSMGIGLFDGPFVEIGGMTYDYALRGVVGTTYQLTEATTLGAYYQTNQSFQFADAVRFTLGPNTFAQNVNMDLPQNVGFGIANRRLADGRLLLAMDVLYKLWDEADLYDSVYENQWVFQFGTQYSVGKYRLRAGYAFAENPIDPFPLDNVGGVIPPGGPPSVRYTQALLAVTSEHRISFGVGIVDMMPGIDIDFMAGGMFHDSEQLGPTTRSSIESYWIGTGLTWRFGACGAGHAPSQTDIH